jgi:hypothetical protein
MRSIALLAILALALSESIVPQANVAPGTGMSFGIPINATSASTKGSTGSSQSWTYTLGGGDIGKNFYFRATVEKCNYAGSQTFKTTISGNDGTGTLIHSGAFTVTSATQTYASPQLATILINTGADRSAKAATEIWTFSIALVAPIANGQSCDFWVDLITYGKPITSSGVGKDGNPGPAVDVWVPCCDSVESTFQVTMNKQDHKYLEVAATTAGSTKWDTLKLTNPASIINLKDVSHWSSAKNYQGTITARTCLSNQSCGIIADDYFVQLTNHGVDYEDATAADFHATFTLTTKAGVATASASIAMVVAALFALFH